MQKIKTFVAGKRDGTAEIEFLATPATLRMNPSMDWSRQLFESSDKEQTSTATFMVTLISKVKND